MSETKFLATFTWITTSPNPCEKCQMLNGKTWIQTPFTPYLVDDSLGEIYDLDNDFSIVHYGCNCNLLVELDLDVDDFLDLSGLLKDVEAAH